MEARFLAAVLRRSWWALLIVGVLGLVIGVLIAEATGPRYEAQASVAVTVPYTTSLLGAPPEAPSSYLATQIDIIRSDSTARLVAARVPKETYRTIEKQLQVSRSGGSDIIDVAATTSSPRLSAKIANATVDVYVSRHLASVNGPLTQELASLNTQLDALTVRIAAARGNAGLLGTLQTQYSQLSQTQHQAQLAENLNATTVSLVSGATAPTAPLPRHAVEKGLLGLLAGLVVSYLVSLGIAAGHPRLRSGPDLEDALGLPIAAALPAHPAPGAPLMNGRVRPQRAKLAARSSATTVWDREIVRVCALIEAIPSPRRNRSVLIVATENASAAFRIARELSRRFQTAGERVRFAEVPPGAPQDRSTTASTGSSPGAQSHGVAPSGVVPTELEGSGLGSTAASDQVQSLIDQTEAGEVSMAVVAGGVLGESTESVVLARSADVVIIVATIPSGRPRGPVVQSVRSSFAESSAQVLLVTTPPDSRNGR